MQGRIKHITIIVAQIAVLIGIIIFVATYIKPEKVAEAWQMGSALLLLLTIPLAIIYQTLIGIRFKYLLPRLKRPVFDTAAVYVAAQPATLIPGGVATRIAFLVQIGADTEEASIAVVINSAINQFFLFAFAVVAGIFFEDLLLYAAIGGAVVLLLITTLSWKRSRVWVLNRLKHLNNTLPKHIEKIINDVLKSTGNISWTPATLLTLGAVFAKVGIMWLVLSSFGVSTNVAVITLAATAPDFIGRISGLPAGGIGVTDAALVYFLTAYAGIPFSLAATAALAYRLATTGTEALFGLLIYGSAWQAVKKKYV